ncbi:hypothetical protein WJX72_000049 [[Myrmecia] bisecta]|uniref:Histone RNA hairpin-binding protein RNA-binding domain-containing protein n=1 Tax=[Myrmecia] bisecta TaxID=41462 RepID=A0AAW1QNL2_9CHLO
MNFGAARAAPVAIKDYSDDFFVEPAGTSNQQQPQQETDARRLQQRQKQIDYGKNTLAYQRYVKAVPRYNRRILHGVVPIDPITPDIRQNISKRCFDGQVKKWRRMLHTWDEKADEADEAVQLVPGGSNPAPPGGRAGASKQPVPEVQPMPMGQRAPSRDNRQQPMVSSGTKRSFAETLKDLPLDVQDDSKRYRRMSNEPAAEGFSPAPAAQPAGGIAAEGPMAAADALTAVEEPAPAAAAEAGATIYDDWEEEDVGL